MRHIVPALRLDDDDIRIGTGQRDSGGKPAATAAPMTPIVPVA